MIMLALTLLIATAWPARADAAGNWTHAIAMHGTADLAPGFSQFPYVRPDAPKGGSLSLGVVGTFDNLNPFVLKGVTVNQIRGYVFESLLARSADEPFTLYGLLAEKLSVPDDRATATFRLNPAARFADGHPVTAEDVVFTQRLLAAKGRPYMRSHYAKVARVEALDDRTVRFVFKAGPNGPDRELPLIIGLMPILPAHLIDEDTFAETTLAPPVGSGPYRVSRVEPGRSVTFARRDNHWARDLPVRRGLFNFDTVKIEFFRSATAMFEAFKSGAIDFRVETDPVSWWTGYDIPAVAAGEIVKRELETGLPDGMRAFVFNTRRPVFQNPAVRRAIIELFDFAWINQTLFNGLYARTDSYFARSTLASTGTPASARERELLAPFPGAVLPSIMDGTWRLPTGDGRGRDRERLRAAVQRLRAGGYDIRGGRMVNTTTGDPVAFEFLARSASEERLILAFKPTLERIGIAVTVRQVEASQYWFRLQSFDFDMISWRWPASLSPGNEQVNRWGSAAAETPGSLNFAGARNPAADAMIDAMLAARDRTDFEAAVRAFDRVLLSGHYVLPLFHAPRIWVAHWSHLRRPARSPLTGLELESWWDGRIE